MNWGKGITIAIILFMGFIISFVVRAFNRDSDLVSDTYYEEGLEYEDMVKAQNNYKLLGAEVEIQKLPEGIQISFPKTIIQPENGEIKFYRPQSKKYDRNFKLKLDQNNHQLLDYRNFIEGFYQVSISWERTGKSYLFEQDITF